MANVVETVGEYKLLNWNGFKIASGMGKGPFVLDDIENRRNHNKSNIFLVAGNPGEGKTYFSIRLGEIFDKDFDVTKQVVFERAQLLQLLGNASPLKRGQVIIVDESQFLVGARSWYDEIQRELLNALEAIRSRGYIIIIVALHRNLLDLIIRQYVLTLMFWMEGRGEATVYEIFTPRFESEAHQTRRCSLKLQLPDYEKCAHLDCLRCKFLYNTSGDKQCQTSRAIYERLKKEAVGNFIKNAQVKAETKAFREKGVSKEQMIEVLLLHRNEIVQTTHNKPDINSIKSIILRELHKGLSTMGAYEISRLYTTKLSETKS